MRGAGASIFFLRICGQKELKTSVISVFHNKEILLLGRGFIARIHLRTKSEMQEVQKLQPNSLDDWLPLTASRNGNTFSTVFHIVSSGIGIQALFLPVGFATLGW